MPAAVQAPLETVAALPPAIIDATKPVVTETLKPVTGIVSSPGAAVGGLVPGLGK